MSKARPCIFASDFAALRGGRLLRPIWLPRAMAAPPGLWWRSTFQHYAPYPARWPWAKAKKLKCNNKIHVQQEAQRSTRSHTAPRTCPATPSSISKRGRRRPGRNNLAAIQQALEKAGLEFTNGRTPGVRSRSDRSRPALSKRAWFNSPLIIRSIKYCRENICAEIRQRQRSTQDVARPAIS